MSNTAMLTITAKVPGEEIAGIRPGQRSAWIRDAIREKAERDNQPRRVPVHGKLSSLLQAARQEYQAAGGRLLSITEAAEEMARRRGER